MKDALKRNMIVIIAIALPIVFIGAVLVSMNISSWFLSTDYNFIYASCGSRGVAGAMCVEYVERHYVIEDGKLTVKEVDEDSEFAGHTFNVHFFFHDTDKNEGREITLAEAQELTLSDRITSPDGVSVSEEFNRGADFFLVYSGSSHGYYLKKGSSIKELNLVRMSSSRHRSDGFNFMGWVIEE